MHLKMFVFIFGIQLMGLSVQAQTVCLVNLLSPIEWQQAEYEFDQTLGLEWRQVVAVRNGLKGLIQCKSEFEHSELVLLGHTVPIEIGEDPHKKIYSPIHVTQQARRLIYYSAAVNDWIYVPDQFVQNLQANKSQRVLLLSCASESLQAGYGVSFNRSEFNSQSELSIQQAAQKLGEFIAKSLN